MFQGRRFLAGMNLFAAGGDVVIAINEHSLMFLFLFMLTLFIGLVELSQLQEKTDAQTKV